MLEMKATKRLNVAVVGLGFGAEFVPLWQRHPHTRCAAICQRNREKLNSVADYFGVEKRCTDFRQLLKDPEIQIVHINTPIPDHDCKYTTQGVYDASKKTHLSFTQGSGHGGSHPHLINEFAMAVVENRDPFPNAVQSANWTGVGLCAHQSALKGGALVHLPAFTL
jgi:hypothetical protein